MENRGALTDEQRRQAFRAAMRVYTSALVIAMVLFIGTLVGLLISIERKTIPPEWLLWLMVALLAFFFNVPPRIARWLSVRTLRKAGIETFGR